MPAAIPIAVAVMAASAVYSGVEKNQEKQHALGAAEAQSKTQDTMLADQEKAQKDAEKKQADTASAAAAANADQAQTTATARKRAVVSGSSTSQSTILTSPLGAPAAASAAKTLLGS